MTVNFSSGQKVYASISDWDEANIGAIARVFENLGTAKEIRFCSIIDGAPCFVYVLMERVDFIDVSQAEYELMHRVLHPPKVEEGKEKPQED
jgi:hypothetical protein